MTDTPFSLGYVPSTWKGGDFVYSPSGSAFNIRSLKIVNTSQSKDAWLWVGDLSTDALNDQLISEIYCPAGSTQILPFDYVGTATAGNALALRQVADQTNSPIFIQSAVASLQSATDLTTYTTGSWTGAADRFYLMTISVKGSNRTISSFTDTHTGQAWSLLQSGTVTFSGGNIYQYVTKLTGANSTTTSVVFSGANTSCFISIVEVQNIGSGISVGEVFAPAGVRASAAPPTQSKLIGMRGAQCGGRILTTYIQNDTNFTPAGDLIEIHDGSTAEQNSVGVSYSKRAGNSGYHYLGAAPGTLFGDDRVSMLVDVHDTSAPLFVTVDGVEVS